MGILKKIEKGLKTGLKSIAGYAKKAAPYALGALGIASGIGALGGLGAIGSATSGAIAKGAAALGTAGKAAGASSVLGKIVDFGKSNFGDIASGALGVWQSGRQHKSDLAYNASIERQNAARLALDYQIHQENINQVDRYNERQQQLHSTRFEDLVAGAKRAGLHPLEALYADGASVPGQAYAQQGPASTPAIGARPRVQSFAALGNVFDAIEYKWSGREAEDRARQRVQDELQEIRLDRARTGASMVVTKTPRGPSLVSPNTAAGNPQFFGHSADGLQAGDPEWNAKDAGGFEHDSDIRGIESHPKDDFSGEGLVELFPNVHPGEIYRMFPEDVYQELAQIMNPPYWAGQWVRKRFDKNILPYIKEKGQNSNASVRPPSLRLPRYNNHNLPFAAP